VRVLLFVVTSAFLFGCTGPVEHVSCGRLLLGSTESGDKVMAWWGERCSGSPPNVALWVNVLERRCDAESLESTSARFYARGTDAEGVHVELRFAFASRSGFCRHGEGVLSIAKGSRVVIADRATFGVLD
jgi:hypothetical protein